MVCPDCEKLVKLVEELRQRIAELEKRLALYENAHTPPSRRRFPERKHDEHGGPLGRPPGFEGSTRPIPKPDRVEVVHASSCPECSGSLGEPAGYRSVIVEEIPEPQPVQVVEYKLACYVCPHCGQGVTATHKDCPKEGVFGFRAMAQVALLKYAGRLPFRLVCEALKRDYGLEITPATVLAVNGRVANSLEGEYEAIRQRIRISPVVHADETGLRVGGVQYWIWIFVTDGQTLVVIRPSRAKKVLKEVLGDDFQGTIVCDGHKSYSNFTNNLQRCWAHLLREFKFASEKTKEATPIYRMLKRLYRKLTHALEGNPPNGERQRLSHNAELTLWRWLSKEWKEKPTIKAVGYLRNGMRHWLTFVTTPGMEPTNNRAERALREHVVIRKIIGALKNEKGTHNHEVITSVLTTMRQRQPDETKLRETLAQAIRGS